MLLIYDTSMKNPVFFFLSAETEMSNQYLSDFLCK